MAYTLSMSDVIVGRSDLEERDAPSKTARGAFRPGLGYELVQPVLDLYSAAGGDAAALDRYRRARDALKLRLTNPNGSPIETSDLRVVRSGAAGGSGYVLEIQTDDAAFWNT